MKYFIFFENIKFDPSELIKIGIDLKKSTGAVTNKSLLTMCIVNTVEKLQ